MAQSVQQQKGSYPLAAYNFRVTVDGASMRFAKVSGLQREYQTLTYQHGLSFAEGEDIAKYHVDKYVSVSLEQGTVMGSSFLLGWLDRMDKAALEVSLCDAQGVPVVTWRIARALPVKLSASAFDAKSNEAAIDTLEIKAAGISIVHV